MAVRKGILGGVPTTTLAGSINNVVTSLTINDATGWTMAVPFVVTLEPGTTNEEQVLVATKLGTTFSNLTRGYGSSGAKAHTASATCFVQHTTDPVSADEENQMVSAATAVGDMLYYDGTKWVPIPHGTQGQVLTEGASPTFVPAWALDSMFALFNNAGEIAVGAADNTPQPLTTPASTGQVLVANTAASLKMAWGQTPTAGYADLSVTQAKLADGIVNSAKMAGNYAVIYQQASTPAAPIRPGSLWFNTGNLYWYACSDGTTWIPLFSNVVSKRVGCHMMSNPFGINANTNTAFAMNWNTESQDDFGFHTGTAPEVVVPVGLGGIYSINYYLANAGPSTAAVLDVVDSSGTRLSSLSTGSVGAGVAVKTSISVGLGEGASFTTMLRNLDSTQTASCNIQMQMTRISG